MRLNSNPEAMYFSHLISSVELLEILLPHFMDKTNEALQVCHSTEIQPNVF